MNYGARNVLKGKVAGIKKGNVMSQVVVDVSGENTISSVMTVDSTEDLNLKEGDRVKAVVKAINVLLVKED